MNANELADEINSYWKSWQQSIPIFEEAATMLRQQQAEIDLLKNNMNTATKELLQKQNEIEELRSLSLRRENLGYFYDLHARQQAEIEALKGEVAYLKHINRNWAISEGLVLKEIEALKAKTLTDEEIHQIFRDESGFEIDTCPIAILDFARAILRKAQKK